jgi:FAD/FMN-containing dehydrogenase
VTGTAIDRIQDEFAGELVRPSHPEYDSLRRVFNGMIDRHPAVIARCTDSADVSAAVNHGREQGLPISIHGGGHGVSGHAVCDEGVMIDLRPMKKIDIDAQRRIARVQGGLTWGEFDAATQEHGLAVTGGRMSTTGIAGFTLGSGSGWLERKHGFAADNLLSAEVVLADGRVVRASAQENPDLFWGLRGGGGNFGVVCEFEFQLHPVGPIMLGGMLVHPGERALEVVRFFRDYMAAAPDEVGAAVALITAPHEPFVPEPARGRPAVGIVACYAGELEDGRRALAPLQEFGPPAIDLVQPMPYTAIQKLIDPNTPSGLLNYWGGDFLKELSDDAIEVLCSAAATVPSPQTSIMIVPAGGQTARVSDDAMALGQRQSPWNTHLIGMWTDPADTPRNIAWLRELQQACAPYTTGRAWLNFLGDGSTTRVRRALGDDKYERLQRVKDRYDPDNVFRLNQNIAPRGAG